MKYNIRLLFAWDDVDEMESYTITVPDIIHRKATLQM